MKVKELLDSEEKWCQGCLAQDAHGVDVPTRHRDAKRWCLIGALLHCYGGGNHALLLSAADERLRDAVPEPFYGISQFNDDPATTFADIRRVLEEADV